jgi:uncharacterized membrane protein YedE/YeeE
VAIASALFGGVLIGLSASALLLLHGRIAGISGILAGLFSPTDRGWTALFLLGLVGGGLLAAAFGGSVAGVSSAPVAPLVGAGLLVGFGTRLGGGCTSGHGVCGIGRGSLRSLVATLTFIATGAATVFVVRHVLP